MARATNVLEYLDASRRRFPDKVALSDEEKELTFEGLADAAARIGSALARRYDARRQPVAVIIDRNVESICAFMGIASSGNFYVPVDASQPVARIASILGQMAPLAVISVGGKVPDGLELPEGIDLLCYESLLAEPADQEALDSVRAGALDIDPLYAICTSGTTGVPKGVLIPHRAVLDFIPVFAQTFGFDEGECFGNQAPFDFDVSVKDIYTTLYCGASMHIIPRTCFSMPKLLAPTLDDRGVTAIIWAVSALSIVAGFKAFKYCVPGKLKKVLFSGEVMPVKHLNIWRSYLPDAMFVNLYGPTEITCNCMYYIVDREFGVDEKLPLGTCFRNESVLVLNEENRPIVQGETGEICVVGTCVGLGYYRDRERTALAFVQNPLNDRYPELMYRTGDLARYNERGELEYAARKDFQIKHMGHRIELEELEVHLNAVEGIDRGCCLFNERANKIVACYVGSPDAAAIVKDLGRKLPKYMIPNIFHKLEALPITKNGKIDRRQLKEDYAS